MAIRKWCQCYLGTDCLQISGDLAQEKIELTEKQELTLSNDFNIPFIFANLMLKELKKKILHAYTFLNRQTKQLMSLLFQGEIHLMQKNPACC